MEKLQESQSLVRTEIQRIFEDIDHFKKQSQTLTQDQLKLKREIQTLDNVKITDLANMMDIHSRQVDDFTIVTADPSTAQDFLTSLDQHVAIDCLPGATTDSGLCQSFNDTDIHQT